MIHQLDNKLGIVCNKIDNLKADVADLKTDVKELRDYNHEQDSFAKDHVPWKYFILIMLALIGVLGGAYAFAWNGDQEIWECIRQLRIGG